MIWSQVKNIYAKLIEGMRLKNQGIKAGPSLPPGPLLRTQVLLMVKALLLRAVLFQQYLVAVPGPPDKVIPEFEDILELASKTNPCGRNGIQDRHPAG